MESAPTTTSTKQALCGQLYHPDWPEGPSCDRPDYHARQGTQTHRWNYLAWTDSPNRPLDEVQNFVKVLRKIPYDSARQVSLLDDGSVGLSFGVFYHLADRPSS